MTQPPNDAPRRGPFRLAGGLRHVERDVDAELAFHLAMRAHRLAERGFDAEAARDQALRQFGDLSAVRAECVTIDRERDRAMRRAIRFDDLRQDATYAIRSLSKRRGFTAVLLLILALGIGANAATFTLVDALLLRPLPVPHPEQLVAIGQPWRTNNVVQGGPDVSIASYPLYADMRDGNRVLAGVYATGRAGRLDVLVAHDSAGVPRTTDEEPEHPRGRYVSGNFFWVLRVPAVVGRTFTDAEDRVPGGDPYVVISHGYWQRRFGGDRAAVGSSITVNGTPLTIVGVTPPGFTGDVVGQTIDLWLPLMMQPALNPHGPWLERRDVSWLLMMGRLAPGVTVPQARAALTTLVSQTMLANATGNDRSELVGELRETGVTVGAGARGFSSSRKTYAPALLILSAAVALVLLVICANVANLLLARATARGREMSVRMAIGAGRRRLVQQLLVESLVLAAAGGALGTLVALWGSRALLRLTGGTTTIALDAGLDGRVLAFTGALAFGTALVFGLAPALHATRVQLATALRTQGRGLTGGGRGPGRLPLGNVLVVGQVALSMLLLVGTGMLVRSMDRLDHADLGIARDRLLILRVDAGRAGYDGPRLALLVEDLAARLARVPGAAAVSYSENGVFSGTESGTSIQVERFVARADSDTVVAFDNAGPAYFRTVGARILRGRDFASSDRAGASRVAIVNETMARFFFPREDALGRHFTIDDSLTYEIVGVVADLQGQGVREPAGRRFYVPMLQAAQPPGHLYFEVRTTGDPARLVEPARRTLRAADPRIAVLGADPLEALVRDSLNQDRLVARVVTLFGVLALVLASLGLYGVIAFATLRRTNEFGLRMALGASRAMVTRLVLGEAMWLLVGGVVIGIPAALATTSLLRDQLFGIDTVDLPSILIATGVLAMSAVVAATVPAMRASRVAPLEALRAD